MLSIGALTSAAQGASYYERDGYYAKDDPEHRAASAWYGKGAEDLGLKGPVDPEVFRQVLEGRCRTARAPSSAAGARTAKSCTAPAATSPSPRRNRCRWPPWSAATPASWKPTTGR